MINIADNKLKLIFGRKGSGKTCCLARFARKAISKKRHVYSNVRLNFPSEYFHFFDLSDLGYFCPEKNALFLCDEINLLWDNRDFKSFDKVTGVFLRYQRHFKATIICYSQTYDCDKKIKSISDELYISVKRFKFGVLKRVDKYITVRTPEQGESDIVEGYELRHFWLPSGRDVYWLPSWYKYHDSYSTYALPTYDDYFSCRDLWRKRVKSQLVN